MGTSRASVEGRHLVLVGMMGVGKTSVGRLVAARLGREFVDTDAAVQVRTGRSVRELFESFGEAAFRDAESEALAAALGRSEPAVIAAGGGAVLRRENRELLAGATVVWLRAGLATLLGRVGSGTHRPLLDTDPVGVLARIEGERRALYAEVADAVVDVDGLPLPEVAGRVLAAVGAGT